MGRLIYAIVIGAPGFFLLNIGMIGFAIRNFILWRRDKKVVSDEPQPATVA